MERTEPPLRLERSILEYDEIFEAYGQTHRGAPRLAAAAPDAGGAAAVKMTVGVRFWRESGDKESMADSAVDTTREATLTRQPNGTFTLELPVKQLSSMNMTGCLTGIAIGEVNYDGTLSGDLSDGTAVLTLKNLPASVLTGSDSSKALAVTCSIKMDTILLGDISTSAKMSIWVER